MSQVSERLRGNSRWFIQLCSYAGHIVGVCRGDSNYKFAFLVLTNITVSASVWLNGRSARSALCLLSFLFANRQRKVVLRAGQTDHTHATVSPVYLWIRRIRIATLARDQTVFLYGMCVSSLDLGAVRKRVVQAGQRFNLGSLRVFGSQSFPSVRITVVDFAAKFIRSETRSVFLARRSRAHIRSVILVSRRFTILYWFIAQLRQRSACSPCLRR